MPDPKLSVLVRVDLNGQHLRLIVIGALTGVNQQGLYPVIHRARTLIPAAEVVLDLSTCTPLEPAAVELLRTGIDQQCRDRPGARVELVLPDPAATDRMPRAEASPFGGSDGAAGSGWDLW